MQKQGLRGEADRHGLVRVFFQKKAVICRNYGMVHALAGEPVAHLRAKTGWPVGQTFKSQRVKKKTLCFVPWVLTCVLAFVPGASLAAKEETAKVPSTAQLKLPALAATNDFILLERSSRQPKPLRPNLTNEANIARMVTRLLESQHYSRRPIDDSVSRNFFARYLEVLDPMRMHFLDSDEKEFESYRTTLDDLTYEKGDTRPARFIFSRFLQRFEERSEYVDELLKNETFDFSGEDTYDLDRKKAPRPRDLADAKALWHKHLRYEILQEKLNKEKPEEIAKKINRRYARLLRALRDYDADDVFEIYLSALSHVYDPHTDYLGKSELENFAIGMKLSLFGIGALLQSEDGYCKIKELVAGGPAAQSKKIKPNDKIIAVAQGDKDPVDVVDMKLNKVVEMIRGPKGTEVRLTIIPVDAPDPSVRKVVTLIRDEIKLEDQEAKAKLIELPCEASAKPMRIGVIDLPSFYASFDIGEQPSSEQKSTTKDVAKLIRKLKEEKVGGIVLDLRRNGGGSLEEAINLTGLFIKEGPVVQVRDPGGKIMVDYDTDPSVLYDGPLVVLTSRFSASASEIVAGALQDYGRALVVGDSSTHGKGTVQSLIQLANIMRRRPAEDPGALKVTIRKFYRASGSSTQLKGVTPDLVLPSVPAHMEVGEATLENPLPWDVITSAKYEKLNRIQPILEELRKRSNQRLEADQDFAYLREDIERMKKALEDKTVSLNENKRLKEKEENEARHKAREAELKARHDPEEKVYEITLKNADEPGLPEPATKAVAESKSDSDSDPKPKAENDSETKSDVATADEEESDESKTPAVDAIMKEAKRILVDLIELSSPPPALTEVAAPKLGATRAD
jgi:carboxyl-terminal processing protease